MADTVRWGILGCGRIARKFATGLADAKGAKLVAAGSRSADTLSAFADEFEVPNRHVGYEALIADPHVDVVYVATPHPMHRPHAALCLEAGKAVLCEKPFTVNAAEARELVSTARRTGCFLMEAMWTRFLPTMRALRELLAGGRIGEARMLQADFGFRSALNPEGRLFDPALAGGALLDIGVYTVSLAHMLFGRPPVGVVALADIGTTGVDEQNGCVLSFDRGELAILSSAIRTATPQEATVIGTEGYARLAGPWWGKTSLTVHCRGGELEVSTPEIEGNGYNYQAEEVGRCLVSGEVQSPVMSWEESVEVMTTVDRIRAQWGVRYPFERGGEA
jgi:predicted dehydrogenase